MSDEYLISELVKIFGESLRSQVCILLDDGYKELENRKNMSEQNKRDTQFQGFAKLLLKELIDNALDEYGLIVEGREHYADLNHDLTVCEDIIARRSYDLVQHACDQINLHQTCQGIRLTTEGMIRRIPDMAELPKEQDHE